MVMGARNETIVAAWVLVALAVTIAFFASRAGSEPSDFRGF